MKHKGKGTSAIRLVLFLIISLTLGLTVYEWNAKHLLGNALPMPFGYGAAVVLSGSMEPELSVNDLIVVKHTEDYQAGDIVVFQEGAMTVVHRLMTIDEEKAVTKGDANEVTDNPISVDTILGEVICTLPGIGALVKLIKTPLGIVSILVISVLLIEGSYRVERKRENEELEQIKEEIRRLRKELE